MFVLVASCSSLAILEETGWVKYDAASFGIPRPLSSSGEGGSGIEAGSDAIIFGDECGAGGGVGMSFVSSVWMKVAGMADGGFSGILSGGGGAGVP